MRGFFYTDLLSSAASYRSRSACLETCVHFVGKDRAGRPRLLLHKHLVLITFEVEGPRQEVLGLISGERVVVGQLVSHAEP